jgi:predicted transcriptional regulator
MKEVVAIHLIDHKELVFESISEAARAIGSDSSNVTRAVKRENGGVCNGY